jgi:hypothetical protein
MAFSISMPSKCSQTLGRLKVHRIDLMLAKHVTGIEAVDMDWPTILAAKEYSLLGKQAVRID